jgi:hypothetical protein
MKKLLILTAVIAAAVAVRAEVTPIDGENGVGFIQVTIPEGASQKILSVPFEACLGGGAGMLSDVISTNGMTSSVNNPADADQIVVLTTNAVGLPVYFYYWHKTGTGWETNHTVRLGGAETNVIPVVASNYPVARGLGFWLKRPASQAATTLYMKGQIPTNSAAVDLPGNNTFTLIGYGALEPVDINTNAVIWTSRYDGGVLGQDQVRIVTNVATASAPLEEYTFWGDLDNLWLTTAGTTNAVIINPGDGFWYLRRGAGSATFKPVAYPQQ